jgi:YVTN family beta-propeller protein
MMMAASSLAAAGLLMACSSDPTSASPARCELPALGAAPGGREHPTRSPVTSVPLSGTPFAVAVAPTGATYVTQLLAATAVRANLPATTLSAPFEVGFLPSQIRMSPDGGTAYVSNQDDATITVVDVAMNRAIYTFTAATGSILTTGLSPDGTRLYALTDYYGVYIVDTETGSVVDSIPPLSTGVLLTGVAFHPFAPCMFIAARDEGKVRTVDLTTNTVIRTDSVLGGRIQNVAVSRDGSELYATDIERSKLIVWDLESLSPLFQEYAIGSAISRNAFDVAVTPDNAQLYVTTLADGAVFVLDRAARTPLDTIVTGGSPRYVGFDGNGSNAVIANEAGSVHFIQ